MVPLLVVDLVCQWSDLASLGLDLQELGGFRWALVPPRLAHEWWRGGGLCVEQPKRRRTCEDNDCGCNNDTIEWLGHVTR